MAMAMASGEQLKNAKIAVLDLINTNKDVLFGKLSDIVTRESKENKWAEVADHAHALGAFPWHRTWDYLRDTTWQNWRKRFVEKREKKEKHDNTGQVPRIVYDEADLLIMEILDGIGKSGPSSSMHINNTSVSTSNTATTAINDIHDILEIEMDLKADPSDVTDGSNQNQYSSDNHIQGLQGDEDGDCNNYHSNKDQDVECSQDEYDEHTNYQNHSGYINESQAEPGVETSRPKIISTSSLSSVSKASLLRKSAYAAVRSSSGRKRPAAVLLSPMGNPDKELASLKCRKIRAELELLQRETYKKDLEILQLERSLGLPASDMTRKFYRFARGNNKSIMNNCSNR